MKRLLLSLMVFAFTIAFSEPSVIDAKAFIQSIQGQYNIELFGGEKPVNPEIANVADSDTGADLAMPYCPSSSGSCDPGYLTFKYSDTVVTREVSGNMIVFAIKVTESGNVARYQWEQLPTKSRFLNFQYKFESGAVGTLEHVLIKR